MVEAAQARLAWYPISSPQRALVRCPIEEIFFGGARGGGKSDAMLGKNAIKAEIYGKSQKGVFFRRTYKDLSDAIYRAKEIYAPLGWKWNQQKASFTSPKGALLLFRYIDSENDALHYQGHGYSDFYMEELTQWGDPSPINKLRAALRNPYVPCQFNATGNPGGPGHNWVKERYIDPEPSGFKIISEEFENPFTGEKILKKRVFIPSKLSDNPFLNTDSYIGSLYQSGSKALVRAWLLGDWNAVEGAYFDCWSSDMVLKPFPIPSHWTRVRSFDWGSASPFSVGWWAIASEDFTHNGKLIPKGAAIRYREWYGAKKLESGSYKGLKLDNADITKGIREREEIGERIDYSVADTAIFAESGGPSIAEQMLPIYWEKADKQRVSGWNEMRGRMTGIDGRPMIYCFSTCTHSIRTIPALQHCEKNPEDLDTKAEDHAADEWRYFCMSRPWAAPESEKQKYADDFKLPRESYNWKLV